MAREFDALLDNLLLDWRHCRIVPLRGEDMTHRVEVVVEWDRWVDFPDVFCSARHLLTVDDHRVYRQGQTLVKVAGDSFDRLRHRLCSDCYLLGLRLSLSSFFDLQLAALLLDYLDNL